MVKLRELFGVKHDAEAAPIEHKYYWTTCFLCTSFWVSLLICLFMPQWLVNIFAINAIAIAIEDKRDGYS